MSDISELKAQKYIETENKRNESEIKKMRAESEREYASTAKKSEIEIKRLKDDYETRINNLKNEQ
jgi:hypothetical protein